MSIGVDIYSHVVVNLQGRGKFQSVFFIGTLSNQTLNHTSVMPAIGILMDGLRADGELILPMEDPEQAFFNAMGKVL